MEPDWIAASIMSLPDERLAEMIGELFTSLRKAESASHPPADKPRSLSPEDTLQLECHQLLRKSFGEHRDFEPKAESLARRMFASWIKPKPARPLSATIRERLGEELYEKIRQNCR